MTDGREPEPEPSVVVRRLAEKIAVMMLRGFAAGKSSEEVFSEIRAKTAEHCQYLVESGCPVGAAPIALGMAVAAAIEIARDAVRLADVAAKAKKELHDDLQNASRN